MGGGMLHGAGRYDEPPVNFMLRLDFSVKLEMLQLLKLKQIFSHKSCFFKIMAKGAENWVI